MIADERRWPVTPDLTVVLDDTNNIVLETPDARVTIDNLPAFRGALALAAAAQAGMLDDDEAGNNGSGSW